MGIEVDNATAKAIAIVGAGTAGLAMLKTLLDIPEAQRRTWNIAVFERQSEVGGLWVYDENPVDPPNLPLSPLYPHLVTNVPTPMMTFPDFPFPAGTPLYAKHEHCLAYFKRYSSHYKLNPHISLNSEVISASWTGSTLKGQWEVTYQHAGTRHVRLFDHLIVAAGVNHFPAVCSWPGQELWLRTSPERFITHAVWYRDPALFANKRILVIGGAASGIDIANQTGSVAAETYLCLRSTPDPIYGAISSEVHRKPDVSHFSANGIVFVDDTMIDVDVVILATGYEKRIPFLEAGNALRVVDSLTTIDDIDFTTLATNLRCIFPLYKHTLSLAGAYPVNALAFVGLNTAKVGNAMLDVAQSIFLAQAILRPDLLPSRETLLSALAADEHALREQGLDPYVQGHALLDEVADEYQDELVALAQPGVCRPFVLKWRRDLMKWTHVKAAWKRVEKLGHEDRWLKGVETEQDWAKIIEDLNVWEALDCKCS